MRENENPHETLRVWCFFLMRRAKLNLDILFLGKMGLNWFLVKTQ